MELTIFYVINGKYLQFTIMQFHLMKIFKKSSSSSPLNPYRGCEGRVRKSSLQCPLSETTSSKMAHWVSLQNPVCNAVRRHPHHVHHAGMKIGVAKTETLLLSRRPGQCTRNVSGVPLKQVEKFEYLGVVFTSDGRQDIELDTRIAAAGAVMRQLQRSVLLRRELGVKAKLAVFKSVFVPILTYGHKPRVMTERTRATEMAFLRRISGLTMLDSVRSSEIRETLQIERSRLRYYGRAMRMSSDGVANGVLKAHPTGRRPRGRPRTRPSDYIRNLVRGFLRTLRRKLLPKEGTGGSSCGHTQAWESFKN
ncbi:Uncharacterised protein r2_g1194 [Pycnogonum litorale]